MENRDGVNVRVLTSHHEGLGLIAGPNVTCRLSLLDFFTLPGPPVLLPPQFAI